MESIASNPDSLSTRLRVAANRLSVCPADPAIPQRVRQRVTRLLGQDAGLSAAWTGPRCSCWPGLTPEDGSPDASGPRPRPRSPLCPRSPGRGITIERDHAVPVGLHMPPGPRRNGSTVLGEQATFLRAAVIGFVASSRHRSGSPALKFSRLHTLGRGTNSFMPTLDPFLTGIRVAERTIEPVMRLEGLEQVRQARLALYMAHAGGVIEHDPLRTASHSLRNARPGPFSASTAPDRRSNTGNQARNDACTTPRNSTSTSPKRAPGCHTRSMNASSRSAANSREPRHRSPWTGRPPRHARLNRSQILVQPRAILLLDHGQIIGEQPNLLREVLTHRAR